MYHFDCKKKENPVKNFKKPLDRKITPGKIISNELNYWFIRSRVQILNFRPMQKEEVQKLLRPGRSVCFTVLRTFVKFVCMQKLLNP